MMHSLPTFIFVLLLLKSYPLQSQANIIVAPPCGCAAAALPLAAPCAAPLPHAAPCATHRYKVEVPPPPPPPPAASAAYRLDLVVEKPLHVAPPAPCVPDLLSPVAPCAYPALAAPAPVPAPAPVVLPAPVAAPAPLATPALLAALAFLSAPSTLPAAAPPAALPAACPVALPVAYPAAYPALADDFSGVAPLKAPLAPITYLVKGPIPAPAPLPANLPLSLLTSPCCRYVSKGIQSSNHIYRGRSKRDVSSKKQQYIGDIRDYVKNLKSARDARKSKKSKLVKRDIKGEYDLLQREQAELDLTLPDIIQYMPETMMPNFKRGKCNIGCKNCVNKDFKEQPSETKNSPLPTGTDVNNENKQPATVIEQQPFNKVLNENKQELPNQRFHMSPRFAGTNYLKRSVNPFQYPCYPTGLMPPPYIPSTMETPMLAQNPGNPIWYQPRPLIDPNGHYVFDRLGHKYEVKNGSLKLVTPSQHNNDNEEVNRSASDVVPAPPSASVATVSEEQNIEAKPIELSAHQHQVSHQQALNEEAQKAFESALQQHAFTEVNAPSSPVVVANHKESIQNPTVGAPASHRHDPSYDPHMDKVIRDIVYRHPDFIDATQHAQGSLTLPEDVTRDETMQFLDKLIRGRLNKWFGGPSEEVPMHNLQDLNRYSRETGTSIKFIPIVTVDKDRLNKYRQEKLAASKL